MSCERLAVVDKALEEYQKLANELWFKGGSCTGGKSEMDPTELQDAKNEDEEFHRIEIEQQLKNK
jgi:hypothetical protein